MENQRKRRGFPVELQENGDRLEAQRGSHGDHESHQHWRVSFRPERQARLRVPGRLLEGEPHGKAHAWAIAVAPLPLVWPAEDLWNIEVVVGVCTQFSETRVRLPDVVVDWAGDRPDILVDPPLLVIEIISSGDSYSETQRLAQDYLTMGIPNIWILDPETETARSCEGKAWAEKTRLEIAGARSTST